MTVHSATPVPAPTAVPSSARPRIARSAAWTAVAFLLADFIISVAALLSGLDTFDHSTGLGLASEAVAAVAFIAGAMALSALAPQRQRLLWLPAVLGLLASGIVMFGVIITGAEAPELIATIVIGLMAFGLLLVGILGSIRRTVWPWWVGVGVALIVPVMFFVLLNAIVLALIWTGVALTARSHPRS
ncbi:hypothetical protein [Diaminobutyricimonas sp. LJ205]|uniref:hypothetical protein n=1 Tax=Diaminobutyricimonas sp. LJ205 TaxID=2683590 RepID=UPI0018DF537E|nr:hypothetical protein [Diaminobutyricimonas sp. LJ205]